VKNWLQRLNRRSSLGGAAFLISGSYLVSRLLGLLRDRLLASHFGVGPTVDAYTAAFRLPELLFTLLVSGAFAVAFIPVLTEHWSREERSEAWEVASSLLNLLMVGTLALGVIIFIFADPLTSLIAPGFDAYRHGLTVDLTRIMLVTPFLFAISSVFGSIQQAFNRFLFYALASVFYNLGIIFGIVFLSPGYSIYGVAFGVVIGTLIQAGVQMLGLIGLGFSYRPSFNLRHKSVRKVLGLMVPRSIDQGIDQLHYTVETVIGSRLAAGSLTSFYYANNLKNVPLVIFGSAIATAAFPRLAARAATAKREGFIEDFVKNARLIYFW
jgi:putative peptidoglycan lipid II flippase